MTSHNFEVLATDAGPVAGCRTCEWRGTPRVSVAEAAHDGLLHEYDANGWPPQPVPAPRYRPDADRWQQGGDPLRDFVAAAAEDRERYAEGLGEYLAGLTAQGYDDPSVGRASDAYWNIHAPDMPPHPGLPPSLARIIWDEWFTSDYIDDIAKFIGWDAERLGKAIWA